MTVNYPIYVGYDQRQHAAWLVCEKSIQNKVWEDSPEYDVRPLSHRELRREGHFDRPWRIDEQGQYWDERDGRPFSTEFSHSRFLTPRLALQAGYRDLVMFVDSDFMFFVPPVHLFNAIDRSKVVSCVKFNTPVVDGKKMDGMEQQNYDRKLWSSLMVFNLGHKDIYKFTGVDVNHEPGRVMHNFFGLMDDEIGEIDPRWNHIPGLSEPRRDPLAVHWSLGGPWMPGYEKSPFSQRWYDSYNGIVRSCGYGQASQRLMPLL